MYDDGDDDDYGEDIIGDDAVGYDDSMIDEFGIGPPGILDQRRVLATLQRLKREADAERRQQEAKDAADAAQVQAMLDAAVAANSHHGPALSCANHCGHYGYAVTYVIHCGHMHNHILLGPSLSLSLSLSLPCSS